MNSKLVFEVPGEPCAQGRPRFSTYGKYVRAYDPAKSRNYKAFAKFVATDAATRGDWKYTELPLKISVTAYLTIAKSKPKRFQKRALAGQERPITRPDVDNIFKVITDALSGILYKDDKQIVSAEINKYYAAPGNARVVVELEEMAAI